MNDIIAFFSRCLLYTVFVVVSKVENTHVSFDMFERVVVTCVQICVLCAAWVVYECCAFIIRSVSRRAAYEHVLMDDAKSTGDAHELEAADAAPAGAQLETAMPAVAPDQAPAQAAAGAAVPEAALPAQADAPPAYPVSGRPQYLGRPGL
jgi:hypothetical protein